MKRTKNKHHVIPQSRGGKKTSHNIAVVNIEKHRLYHQLFANKTPRQIIDWLNSYFWNDNYEITVKGG